MSGPSRAGPVLAIGLLAACGGDQGPARGGEPAADEGVIVFVSARSGAGDLYRYDPATGEIERTIGTPEPEGTPRWDPAGGRLVHQRFVRDTATLYVGDEALFVDPTIEAGPQWSSRGRIVYAAARDGQIDLYSASSDGDDERALTADTLVERYPAWSPDGALVAYAKRLETGWDVFTLDPATGVETRRTREGRYVGHLAWSPDGGRIAFDHFFPVPEGTPDGQAEIAVLDLATGAVARLTTRAGNDLVPTWSPDGRRIAFGADVRNEGNWDVWIVEVDAPGAPLRVTTAPGYDGAPVWIPGTSEGSAATETPR